MNERIKELMIEAGSTGTYQVWFTRNEVHKLAELIVKKCIEQINEAIPETNCSASGAYRTAKNATIFRIKDHFGVEE
jgi:hypothetical protein